MCDEEYECVYIAVVLMNVSDPDPGAGSVLHQQSGFNSGILFYTVDSQMTTDELLHLSHERTLGDHLKYVVVLSA